MPRFSIVTPSFNQLSFLRRTAKSVLDQTGNFDLQWIVVDGGSTDGTAEWLAEQTDSRLSFTTGTDAGQADAINKGFARADGDIVGWLNSDDLYADGALQAVAHEFDRQPFDWLIGRCENIDVADQPVRSPIAAYKDFYLRRYSRRRLLRENFIAQPAVFWRRTFGRPLDPSLHYTMDYDLWLRFAVEAPPRIINQVISKFRIHPASKSGGVQREQFDEGYRVAQRYGSGIDLMLHRLNVEKIVWTYRLMKRYFR